MQPLDFLLKGAGVHAELHAHQAEIRGRSAGCAVERDHGSLAVHVQRHGVLRELRILGAPDVLGARYLHRFLGNNENNIPGDNFAQKRSYLDASFSYKLPMDTDLSICLELQNLTNEQLLTYFRNDPLTPRASFAPGRQILLGVVGQVLIDDRGRACIGCGERGGNSMLPPFRLSPRATAGQRLDTVVWPTAYI